MKMRNIQTGELSPVHEIGTTADGRRLLARVDGWDLCDNDGKPIADADFECDGDGNYILNRGAAR
jgi:hypothetical protein